MPAISTGLALGIAAAASAGGTAVSAVSAHKAASAQSSAAKSAAQLQYDAQQKALNFQKTQYNNTQAEQSPFLQTGYGGLANLASLLGIMTPEMLNSKIPTFNPATGKYEAGTSTVSSLLNPALGAPGSLAQGYNTPFVAPTGANEENDPGYNFRLEEGKRALQNSASARGTLLSGATARDIESFGQDYASNEYQNVYNRALQNYSTAYNVFSNNQSNLFNRLSGLAGGGQQSANLLSNAGLQTGRDVAGTLQQGALSQGNAIQNAGAAQASGYAGVGNAVSSGFNQGGQLALLSSLLRQNPAGQDYAQLAAGLPG